MGGTLSRLKYKYPLTDIEGQLVYFHLSLGCDSPILEALYNTCPNPMFYKRVLEAPMSDGWTREKIHEDECLEGRMITATQDITLSICVHRRRRCSLQIETVKREVRPPYNITEHGEMKTYAKKSPKICQDMFGVAGPRIIRVKESQLAYLEEELTHSGRGNPCLLKCPHHPK
jgi:hypothetical protein